VPASQRWVENEEVVCRQLLGAQHLTPGSTSGGGRAGGSAGGAGGGILLYPGVNRLVFSFAPVRDGLYCLKHLTAGLGGGFELRVPAPPAEVLPPPSLAAARRGAAGQLPVLPVALPGAADAALGQVNPVTGGVTGRVVLVEVQAPATRVAMAAAAPGGGLLVGQPQWLGLLVHPQHDALHRARLHLQPRRHLLLGGAAGGGPSAAGVDQSLDSFTASTAAAGGGGGGSIDGYATPPVRDSASGALLPHAQSPLGQQQQPGLQSSQHPAAYVVPLAPEGLQDAAERAQRDQRRRADGAGASTSGRLVPAGPGSWLAVTRGVLALEQALPAGPMVHPVLVWLQVRGWEGLWSGVGPCCVHGHVWELRPRLRHGSAAESAAHGWVCGLQVQAGQPAAAPQPLRLTKPSSLQQQQQQQQQPLGSKHDDPPVPGSCLEAAAELEVQLEYHSGVWRSHTCLLAAPLRRPFLLGLRAHPLPGDRLVVQVGAGWTHSATLAMPAGAPAARRSPGSPGGGRVDALCHACYAPVGPGGMWQSSAAQQGLRGQRKGVGSTERRATQSPALH